MAGQHTHQPRKQKTSWRCSPAPPCPIVLPSPPVRTGYPWTWPSGRPWRTRRSPGRAAGQRISLISLAWPRTWVPSPRCSAGRRSRREGRIAEFWGGGQHGRLFRQLHFGYSYYQTSRITSIEKKCRVTVISITFFYPHPPLNSTIEFFFNWLDPFVGMTAGDVSTPWSRPLGLTCK